MAKAQAAFEANEEKELKANLEAAEKKKTEGNELLQQKKIEEAIVCYDEAIKLNPNSAIYFANRLAFHFLFFMNYDQRIYVFPFFFTKIKCCSSQ